MATLLYIGNVNKFNEYSQPGDPDKILEKAC